MMEAQPRRSHKRRRQPWAPGAPAPDGQEPADRQAYDVPLNAKIAVSIVSDPYGLPGDPSVEGSERATLQPARRADGTAKPGAPEWVPPEQAKIAVTRSLRDDPLGRMFARSQIDQVQFDAGRHWQVLYERSSVGSVQSVDTTKEPVDGGKMPEMVTDAQRNAIETLRKVEASVTKRLGEAGAALIRAVLGYGLFLNQVAGTQGDAGQERGYSLWFRKCLDVLAEEFGYASRTRDLPYKKLTESGR